MTRLRFVALPSRRVAASRLAWRVSQAIVARKQGWYLESVHISRRWRFQTARSRRTASAHVSFFFDSSNPRGAGAAFAIYVERNQRSVLRELAGRLGTYGTYDGKSLVRTIRDTSPRVLLTEMDRIAQTFGSEDRHRIPRSRSRANSKRLTEITEAVLAHGTWTLETSMVWLRRDAMCAAITATSDGIRNRPEVSTMLYITDRSTATAAIECAKAGGYEDHADAQPDAALMKLLPLSSRTALAEARFLETQISALPR